MSDNMCTLLGTLGSNAQTLWTKRVVMLTEVDPRLGKSVFPISSTSGAMSCESHM